MHASLPSESKSGSKSGSQSQSGSEPQPGFQVRDVRTISTHRSYHGWPTVARLETGELLVVVSAGRERHVCPFGQVHLLRSSDDGRSWTGPEILANGPLDDRDAGILQTRRGTLLVNWFTSIAWLESLNWTECHDHEALRNHGEDGYFARCRKIRALLTDDVIQRELGVWMVRSTDGGRHWEEKYWVAAGSGTPHGPIELADGNLLFVGNWRDCPVAARADKPITTLGARLSRDEGRTWELIGTIPERPCDNPGAYHEPHAVQLPDGRIIVHIRNHNEQDGGHILQCESADGGRTFSVPRDTGLVGLPAHLLLLRDGRLLTTYGYRHPPFGNRAAVSSDGGRIWSAPMVLDEKPEPRDLGYPSTVELADGSLVSVWYEQLPGETLASVQAARWIRVENA